MRRERDVLLAHLEAERGHVLATVGGLGEEGLTRAAAPSGCSIAQLLNHLTYGDEIFWACAIVGGDEEGIGLIQDGWKVPVTSGADAVEQYRRWGRCSDVVLTEVDLDAAPRWWPRRRSFLSRPSRTHASACSGSSSRPLPTPAISTSPARRSTATSTWLWVRPGLDPTLPLWGAHASP